MVGAQKWFVDYKVFELMSDKLTFQVQLVAHAPVGHIFANLTGYM